MHGYVGVHGCGPVHGHVSGHGHGDGDGDDGGGGFLAPHQTLCS